ncbi:hypothetical protein AB0L80_41915 [Streptomyces sp. NPDC052069]
MATSAHGIAKTGGIWFCSLFALSSSAFTTAPTVGVISDAGLGDT